MTLACEDKPVVTITTPDVGALETIVCDATWWAKSNCLQTASWNC